MKILAISDEVLKALYQPVVKKNYGHVDLVLGCGDLPYYYLDFLASALDKPLLYVRGNHDGDRQYSADLGEIDSVRGGASIHRRCVSEQGALIAGLEGSVRYKPNASCMYTQLEMSLFVMRLAPQLLINRARYGRALDILVTHAPPFGIHDMDDLPHTGFKTFLTFMRLFQPRYLLHGHIHRYRRDLPYITQYHQTSVINVYPSYVLDFEL